MIARPDVALDVRETSHTSAGMLAYVRALQLSENASVNDVPAEDRSKLGGAK